MAKMLSTCVTSMALLQHANYWLEGMQCSVKNAPGVVLLCLAVWECHTQLIGVTTGGIYT